MSNHMLFFPKHIPIRIAIFYQHEFAGAKRREWGSDPIHNYEESSHSLIP